MPVHHDPRPVPTVIGGAGRAVSAAPAGTGRPRRVRLALLDEHEGRLGGTASWLRANAQDLEVALTATTWLQLVHSPAFPTDLVLIDVQLREAVSIEARIRTCRAAGAAVIVRTGLQVPDLRARVLRAGAAAFIGTDRPLEDVLAVAREVTGASDDGAVQRDWRPLPLEPVERPRLSLGEESALRLYTRGLSTSEVAEEMHVQFETAKTYLRRVREKYAKASRPASRKAELVERATEDGYI